MLDIKLIRENPERAKQGALKKCFPDRAEAVDRLLAVDTELRALIPRIDEMRAEQKRAAKNIGKMSAEEREVFLAEQREHKAELQKLEQVQRELQQKLEVELLLVPNFPDAEVPEGADDQANEELRTWGEKPSFDFDPKPHYELAEARGWVDFERAADMAGSRNYMLFGDLALLHDAVLRFALDHLVGKGFVAVEPPLLVRDKVMTGTGFFPGGEEQTYRCEHDGLNLIGTAEVPVTSIHSGEILAEDELPKLYVARSSCFRREAGTYGKDTRGLYRVTSSRRSSRSSSTSPTSRRAAITTR